MPDNLNNTEDKVSKKVSESINNDIEFPEVVVDAYRVIARAYLECDDNQKTKKFRYTFRKEFDLQGEIDNENLLPEAAEFISTHHFARDALKNLYEYDAYTYIHTAQMLNTVCILMHQHCDEIKYLLKKGINDLQDKNLNIPNKELKEIFLIAVVFHDWGKTKVDRDILNYGDLTPAMYRQVQKHTIGTVDIVIDKIVNKKKNSANLKRNKVIRENDNEARDIISDIDQYIYIMRDRGYDGLPYEEEYYYDQNINTFEKDLEISIKLIEELHPEAEQLRPIVEKVITAFRIRDYNAIESLKLDIITITDIIRSKNSVLMEEVQPEIQDAVNEILKGDGRLEDKKVLKALYISASHHRHKNYPTEEEIGGILPHYKEWLGSSGREQGVILEIVDVADALLSKRPYKKDLPIPVVKGILEKGFSLSENEHRFPDIINNICKYWEKLRLSDEFLKRRELIDEMFEEVVNTSSES